ncbi:diguanylate cyclase [Roseibium sp. FZY0029]|uniref:sensor domain-containing diguanylate cyclase n=1 Tax=Roseibium sp. FZY0029 TaxID=3116647 RepID=UPI002EA5FD7A|nr:diguanylate cyclase [Roseibium sp. FZY0029]
MAKRMHATDTINEAVPSETVVDVGYYSPAQRPPPSLPAGYVLHRVTVQPLTNCPFQICLLDVASTGKLPGCDLRRIRESTFIIACADRKLPLADQLSLIDGGVDDVVNGDDADLLLLALRRAELMTARQGVLFRKCRDLATERDNLQAAIDNLPSPIFFKDRAGIYSGCNKAFEAFIGLPASKVRGASVYDVAPEELAKVYQAADEELMQRGGVQIYEAEVCYADGKYRTVTFHKAVTQDPVSGEVNGLAGSMLDITERKRLEEQLKRAAERDALTDAYNRRRFFELADSAEERAKKTSASLSILVLDVDHFKQINDRFGHACGDAALNHIVGLLKNVLQAPHIFARAGGEEFYCLLENCGLDEAFTIAERIREAIETTPHMHGEHLIPMRVSIGGASVADGEKISQTIARADDALYSAKQAGRNRVCMA